MNARFYVPTLNRFASADTIVPDPGNPQSFNRYSYVRNNPINSIDPTGHSECGGPYDQTCNIPDWWLDGAFERVSIDGYGLFDLGHVRRGYDSAEFIWNEVIRVIDEGGGDILLKSGDGPDRFERIYSVSGEVAPEQLEGVVLGIYMDFELSYEAYQRAGGTGIVGIGGAFAPEDLPSDYIGAWAFLNGYERNEIPAILEGLGNVENYQSPFGERGGSLVFGYSPIWGISIPRNYEFTPMAPKIINYGLFGQGVKWENVPWPHELQMTPIESSETTWWAN